MITEQHSEFSQTSKMELFAKIFNGFESLTIFKENSILDILLGSEYVSSAKNLFCNIRVA